MAAKKSSAEKPHAVCVPFPAQGHVNPMMQLAKLLHSKGFFITFVNTEFNHRRLVRASGGRPEKLKGLSDFRFETMPDSLPPSDRDATQDPVALCDAVGKNFEAPFRQLLARLINSSSPEVPRVSCVVSDGFMSFAIKVADEMGLPEVQFWTASACGFMAYLQYPELKRRGIVPFKDENFISDGSLDKPVEWIPGMRNMRLKDIPSLIQTTDPNDVLLNFVEQETQNCLKSSAIIFNTFDALEHQVFEAIKLEFPRTRIYTAGPLSLLARYAWFQIKYIVGITIT